MRRLTLNISCNHISLFGNSLIQYTLYGVDKEKVVLELTQKQYTLMESRAKRAFYIRCPKELILKEIDSAPNSKALKAITEKYYLCDACDFNDINIYGVKRLLKAVVEILYRYPRLRSKLCFIGTHHAMEKMLIKLEQGDDVIIKDLNLQYICSIDNAKKVGRIVHHIVAKTIEQHEIYIATAINAYGLLDAVLLDKNDYEGYAYLDVISNMRESEAMGFHPKGCNTPESVVYHELGHLIDNMCNLSESYEFKSYYKTLSRYDIEKGLSQYALENDKEFIAEAFAEYMSNPKPRLIAMKVGELLDRAYGSLT